MTAFFPGPGRSPGQTPSRRGSGVIHTTVIPYPRPAAASPCAPAALDTARKTKLRQVGALGVLLLCLLCLCILPCRVNAGPIPPTPAAPHMGLLPYLEAFLDPTGSMDVDEVAAPANNAAFRPLTLQALPRTTGVLWLRFTLAPLPQGLRPPTLLLDLGPAVPADPVLYAPYTDPLTQAAAWRETRPSQRNVLLLPEAADQPRTCFLRLDGLPGPWFAPTLRTPQDAASNWDSLAGTAAVLALGVVLLLCLLRGLSEKGQWRAWTALYVGMALLQAVLGMPAYGEGRITPAEAAAVLSPGLALMLLPHVGRHLLRTRGRSRALDVQFLLLSLPGAALALLPLLPGYGWLIRYLALWPAGALLFVPTALAGALMGLGGARRFLLGCLVPPLFVAASILGLDQGYAAGLLAAAPLWGTALSALLIAGTGQPRDMAAAQTKAAAPAADPLLALATDPVQPGQTASAASGNPDVITLDQPLDDPNLRLLPSLEPASGDALSDLSGLPDGSDWSPSAAPMPAAPTPTRSADAATTAHREALRPPLEKILREGTALLGCALPPAVRQHAENLRSAADELARVLDNPGALAQAPAGPPARTAFNLQHLVREAHDAVSVAAENAGIGLAWYLPPLLGHMYEGPGQALRQVLDGLLESAVRATAHGAVHLTVRRVPESADPGHLLFTVTDTGAGLPPRSRSGQALLRAWELAGVCNGYLTVDSGPQGASIAFTLRLTPLEAEEEEEAPAPTPTVAVVGADAEEQESLTSLCREQGCLCLAAPDLEEALRRNAATPAVLLTALRPQYGPAQADLLGRFEAEARRAGLPVFKALAVTPNQRHWDALAETGYTHALLTPLDAAAFTATLREVLDEAGLQPRPDALPQDAPHQDAPREDAAPPAHGTAAPLPDLFGPQPEPEVTQTDATPPVVIPTHSGSEGPDPVLNPPQQGAALTPAAIPAVPDAEASPRAEASPTLAPANPQAAETVDAARAARYATDPEHLAPPAEEAPAPEAAQATADSPLPDLFGPDPFGAAPKAAPAALVATVPALGQEQVAARTARTSQENAASPAQTTDNADDRPEAPVPPEAAASRLEAAPLSAPAVVLANQPDMDNMAAATDGPAPDAATAAMTDPAHKPDTPADAAVIAESPTATDAASPPTFAPEEAGPEARLPEEAAPQDEFLVAAGLGGPQWEEPTVSAAAAGALLAQRPGEAVLTPVGTADAAPSGPTPVPASTDIPAGQATDVAPQTKPAPSLPAQPEEPLPKAATPAPSSEATAPFKAAADPSDSAPSAPQAGFVPPNAAQAMPGPAGWANYDLADEWVGEPMPVGTPVNPARSPAAAPKAVDAPPRATAAANPQPASSAQDHRRYVSPSIATAGEWVGEPMPMTSKPAASAAEADARPAATSRQTGTSPQPAAPRQTVRVTSTPWPVPKSTPAVPPTAGQPAPLTLTGLPEQPPQTVPPRDMPRTAAGRLILKLLGGLSDHAAPPADPLAVPPPTAAPAAAAHSTAANAANGQQTSIVNFIAGAAPSAKMQPSAAVSGAAAQSAAPSSRPAARTQAPPQAPERDAPPAQQSLATSTPQATPFSAPPKEDATLIRLVERLDAAMEDAQEGYRNRRCPVVGEAAARIAAESDAFGFRVLARMARCVERAARASDMNALHDLLPELAVAVERNRIALNPHGLGG